MILKKKIIARNNRFDDFPKNRCVTIDLPRKLREEKDRRLCCRVQMHTVYLLRFAFLHFRLY